jgi:outer membrane lipoprotein-sorting protein
MMILIMMTSTLAGCTGGDPDGGGEIDTDAVNDLIDQNLQDFINNTTITVNQEIHHHYYNNTTVNEGDSTNNAYNTEYNNTTVIDGGEVTNYDQSSSYYNSSAGGGSTGIVHTIDFVFDLDFLWGNSPIAPGDRENSYTTNWSYYDYNTNSYRNDVFTYDCEVYYLVGAANNSNQQTYWENNNYYDDAWSDNGYNNTMRDLFHNTAGDSDLRFTCDEDFYGYNDSDDHYAETIYEFTIPQGFGLRCFDSDSFPILYSSTGNSSNQGFGYEWSGSSQVGELFVDGIYFYYGCGNNAGLIGGEYDMTFTIRYNYLDDDRDYRLIWSYELIPVIPNDANDLDD